MKEKNNKGFTLAELLIVVAIIAVLVAIAIPIFNSQLEKAREATDLANIRAAYAECCAAVISGEIIHEEYFDAEEENGKYTASKIVLLKQKKPKWQMGDIEVGGVTLDANKLTDITFVSVTVDDSGEKPRFFNLDGPLEE